jgi:hypothetical protein
LEFKISLRCYNLFKEACFREYKGKNKLSNDSAKYLSKFIQESGEKCYLKHNSNAFKTGERKNSAFWRGIYQCTGKDCANYVIEIENLCESTDDEVKFKCKITGKINHEEKLDARNDRFCGDKRSELALKILEDDGVENAANTYILEHHDSKKILLSNEKNKLKDIFRKVKEEFSNSRFISNGDALENVKTCRRMFEILDTVSKNIIGVVQQISASPFGFLIMTEVQVNIYYSLFELILEPNP